MSVSDIILGDGVFTIGGTAVGLTRGGGKFVVEREYRTIEADGDYGPVKERIRKIKSVAKLTLNALEIIDDAISKRFPAMTYTNATPNDSFTGAGDVVATDYNTVTWTGKTKGGKAVIITIENAINLENLDWALVDKEEVVHALTYTATYLETARTTEPWKVEFAD